jgi:hypothetical protein
VRCALRHARMKRLVAPAVTLRTARCQRDVSGIVLVCDICRKPSRSRRSRHCASDSFERAVVDALLVDQRAIGRRYPLYLQPLVAKK